MSLKGFHILFVTCSSLLSFGFGGWSVHAWQAGRGGSNLAMGLGAFAVGVILIAYGLWFLRKIKTREQERAERRKHLHTVKVVLLAATVCLLATDPVPACGVCYGDAEGQAIDAARLGVWLLFGLTGLVQVCFVAFFIRLWRGARRHRDERYGTGWQGNDSGIRA